MNDYPYLMPKIMSEIIKRLAKGTTKNQVTQSILVDIDQAVIDAKILSKKNNQESDDFNKYVDIKNNLINGDKLFYIENRKVFTCDVVIAGNNNKFISYKDKNHRVEVTKNGLFVPKMKRYMYLSFDEASNIA